MIGAVIGEEADCATGWFDRLRLKSSLETEPGVRIGYSEGASTSFFDDGRITVATEMTVTRAVGAREIAEEYSQSGLNLRRLPADASFILHDRAVRRSVVATGFLSRSPLCFFRTVRGSFVVGSRIAGLVRHRDAPRSLDELYLAHLLSGFGAMAAGSTAIAGIERVRAGCAWVIEPGVARQRPVDRLRPNPLSTRRERIDAFWGLLSNAVRSAARPTEAACLSLSGGVDSAAIAYAMASSGEPLEAFSIVAPNLDASAEEPGLRLMERAFEPMRVTRVDASGAFAYPNTERYDLRDDPPLLPMAFLAVRMHLWSTAAAAGFRTVIEGEGGDELFSSLATPLDAVLRGKWRTLIRQMLVRAGRKSLFQWGVALPLAPSALRTALARRWSGARTGLAPFMDRHLGTRREIVAAREQLLAGLVHVPFAKAVERWLESPMTIAGALCRTRLASSCGIALAWPLLDRKVIELALGLDPDDLLSQSGEDKAFLRMALRERIPDAVRARPKDVRLHHLLASRMLGSADCLRVVRDPNVRKRLCGWIDFGALEAALCAAGARKIGNVSLLWQLESVVSFADWYARASREWGLQ